MTQRTITIVTANLGRGATAGKFNENLLRLKDQIPGNNTFFGFQEIDEADTPEEMAAIKKIFGSTHRFVGTTTRVPIAVPRSFGVKSRSSVVASEGVDGLSPRRVVVKAVVFPDGHPDKKLAVMNTHFARDATRLGPARTRADSVLRSELEKNKKAKLPSWLTADLNSRQYRSLASDEKKLVQARLDYIRAYEFDSESLSMELLKTGSVDLTIDGHNAHWAKVRLTWK